MAIQPEHDTIRGLITYLNYSKDTGFRAERVDKDQEESWARQLYDLLKRLSEAEAAESTLNKLEAAGVDNWSGYRYALQDE